MSYNTKQKRPLEVQMILHDLEKEEGISVEKANRKNRAACDALFIVQVLRDGVNHHYLTTSYDAATKKEFEILELFNTFVSLAGHIARLASNPETELTHEEAKIRRFVIAVLTQLKLSEKLGALEPGKKPEAPVGLSSKALGSLEEAIDGGKVDEASTLPEMAAMSAEINAKANKLTAQQLVDIFSAGEMTPLDDDMKGRN